MKRLLLSSLLALLLVGFAQAQASITVSPEVVDATFSAVDLSQYQDLEVHISVTNTSTETVHLKWTREVPAGCPAGWKTQVCDNITCYPSGVSSNVDPNIQLNEPFVLAPGETYSNFLLHVIPGTNGLPGCCQPKIHFSTVENPDVILATVTYNVSINTVDCGFTYTNEEISALAALRAYPNPSTGTFSISDNPLVKQVVVYNILGKKVRAFQHRSGNQYDIAMVPDGLYLVSMVDAKGETLKTVRLAKRDLRP